MSDTKNPKYVIDSYINKKIVEANERLMKEIPEEIHKIFDQFKPVSQIPHDENGKILTDERVSPEEIHVLSCAYGRLIYYQGFAGNRHHYKVDRTRRGQLEYDKKVLDNHIAETQKALRDAIVNKPDELIKKSKELDTNIANKDKLLNELLDKSKQLSKECEEFED
jgi:hypothetical protein